MRRRVGIALTLAGALVFAARAQSGRAQTEEGWVRPRIAQAIDDRQRIVLHGNIHRLARPEFDRGAAPPDLQLDHILLALTRTAEQQAALDELVEEQQDKASPKYHHWLTAQQFGEQFGASPDDIAEITDWLESHGFTVDQVLRSRGAIEFSGTAGQVQDAFHTALHRYEVKGQEHWANASEPEIPAALGAVVSGVVNLNSFFAKPKLVRSSATFPIQSEADAQPLYSAGGSYHALAPQDMAAIYNLNSLYQAGVNGNGVTIGVVGRSNINLQDIKDFRRVFGLSNNPPQVIVNGTNPGDLGGGEEDEAVLDNSWAGAVAPGATVKFVVSASTQTADGTLLSEQYIINNNLADVMTESFGLCEADVPQSYATYLSGLAQQAAAEGITYLVSTGDTGSSGCDSTSETTATGPLSVNVLASSPYITSVGGTQFNEGSGTYWNSSNSSSYGSALSYIPERVWNQSCTTAQCGGGANIVAGAGGASVYFTKPSWQTGVAGIPNDGARDLPDVSLTASAAHDPYLLCIDGSCAASLSTPSLEGIGGTSASSPAFAGIMALVTQNAGSRQGAANAILYRLAASEQLSGCNASSGTLPGSSCIFNDVTAGNNSVPGGHGYGSTNAYTAGTGYDLATGLGSVNAANLVNQWSSASNPSNAAVSLNPLSIAFGNQTINTTSAARTVTLTNSGSATLNISSIAITGTNPHHFTQTNTCGSSLSAGVSCTISVTFVPQATQALSAKVTVTDNAPNSPQSVSLSGTGVSVPVVGLSPTSLAFGNVAVGAASAVQTVTLTNTGTAALAISSVALTGTNVGAFVENNTCGASVSAGAHCTISVKMQPPSGGSKSAAITIADNAAGSPHAIGLSGTAVQPTVSLSPSALTFSSQAVGTRSAAQTVTLTNTSSLTVSITSVALGGTNPTAFTMSKTCGSTLSAGASCTASVTFAPLGPLSKSATLVIADNAANSPQSIAVTGTATGPLASLSPASIAFGNQAVNSTSAAKTVTLTNSGNAAMTISSIAIAGANPHHFKETTNCGSSLNAGANCTISATFAPLAAGSLAATVTVTDNGPGSPHSVTLSGTGTATPAATLSTGSFSFASQAVGTSSSAQTVTLTNNGNATLAISGIAMGGANPTAFVQSKTCGSTLSAGANCTISVKFAPSGPGSKTATVVVTDNAPNSPQSITLTGTATGPLASLSPASIAFGNQAVNSTSAAKTVTLTNTGNTAMTISGIAIAGTNPHHFKETTNCGSTLNAGASCTISATFAPLAAGSLAATVTVTDNAPGSSQSVSLSGTGVASPASLARR
ncbi:MAG TPA: choice-of-anchor D domain-containing protein [Terriglobia bacterium]|nr:choice-of-anchor D domain-containing protein [Terriglobia bacterium]